jgi:hypothetical protein
MTLPTIAEEILYGRPLQSTAFISSKMGDGALEAERKAAIRAINATRVAKAWCWERDGIAGSFCSRKFCVSRARASDLLFLILEDDLTPITRAEYRAARNAGVNCCILIKQSSTLTAAANRFVTKERRVVTTRYFGKPSELKSEIIRSLTDSHSYGIRMEILRRLGIAGT